LAYWLPVSLLAALAGLMAAKKKVLKRPSSSSAVLAHKGEGSKADAKERDSVVLAKLAAAAARVDAALNSGAIPPALPLAKA